MRAKKEPRRHGLLLVDKPSGMTSHDVVAKVRQAAGQKRVGHTGTLDPMATGLMAVLLGSATRLEPWLTKMDKVYSGRIELGLATDTDDITGRVLERSSEPAPPEDVLRQALAEHVGSHDQRPPAYSAVKVAGRRSHQAARAGDALELKARPVVAHKLTLLAYEPPFLDFRAEVGSGYYIRSLARDLGADLGLGGALAALRRETVGPWSLDRAVTLEELAAWDEDDWRLKLAPPAEALPHLPAATLDEEAARRFCQGQRVPAPDSRPGGTYKILDRDGSLLGLADCADPPLGESFTPLGPYLRPLRVFNTPGD